MEAILKNQLRHVSLAVSFTSSTVNGSEEGGHSVTSEAIEKILVDADVHTW